MSIASVQGFILQAVVRRVLSDLENDDLGDAGKGGRRRLVRGSADRSSDLGTVPDHKSCRLPSTLVHSMTGTLFVSRACLSVDYQ
jgi:hypothetical protein